jgi:hypothetical protein
MWDVLIDLSTPPMHERIGHEIVRAKVQDLLDRYADAGAV